MTAPAPRPDIARTDPQPTADTDITGATHLAGTTAVSGTDDDVVLLDEDGTAIGRAPRLAVHGSDTPLHLAFSIHLFDDEGRVLITRRALSKKTWPGVWTNSCCGHPRPNEDPVVAVRRRVREELGLDVQDVTPVVPDFRYRAVDASGVVENEVCPVYVGTARGPVRADPAEVVEHSWIPWADYARAVAATPAVFSPWSVLQVPHVDARLVATPLGARLRAVHPNEVPR
ncbi:isopentenyl-diphosphate Delta-isomerase [Agilicoccus flavus]|uniref:isopentenyl-diphosphate Delta-isomerase n=1 Tax=Agilicoccus flavus TaxID=2775968 RepID=UPI0021F5CA99|nr:isopentenyl-diphosphate Delta-isomerase [Agilicoccus flavus]